MKRSLILCKVDEGLTDQQVAEAVMVGPATVGRVRQRFVEGGLKRALDDLPRPGQRRKLDGKQEAHLVAVACSAECGNGAASWLKSWSTRRPVNPGRSSMKYRN